MDGHTNFAYIDDNDKELDDGTIDRDIEPSFYSSKLVIDFSKEDSPQIEQRTYKSPTKRIEFETSRSRNSSDFGTPSRDSWKNEEPEFRTRKTRFNKTIRYSPNMNNSQNVVAVEEKPHKKKLIILYCIGIILVIIGIALIIVGSISNHKETSDTYSTSLPVPKTNTLKIETQKSAEVEIISSTSSHKMENVENGDDHHTTKARNVDDKIYFKE